MKEQIFLSYVHNDKPWVSEFVNSLTEEGVDVWSDQKILPGDDWSKMVEESLRNSNTLVIVLSSNSVKSPWLFFEIGAAIAGDKKIIPVVIDDIRTEQLPLALTKYQYLREKSPQKASKEIAKVVSH